MAENDIKIVHRRASNYANHFITGALLSGPTPDGQVHLTFYADCIQIVSETGSYVEEGKYTTSISAGDLESFREDKVTIAVTEEILESIAQMLQTRFKDKAVEVAGD